MKSQSTEKVCHFIPSFRLCPLRLWKNPVAIGGRRKWRTGTLGAPGWARGTNFYTKSILYQSFDWISEKAIVLRREGLKDQKLNSIINYYGV